MYEEVDVSGLGKDGRWRARICSSTEGSFVMKLTRRVVPTEVNAMSDSARSARKSLGSTLNPPQNPLLHY